MPRKSKRHASTVGRALEDYDASRAEMAPAGHDASRGDRGELATAGAAHDVGRADQAGA